MGILDEAIKEHLELKRQHGAGESELKQLEDEAFGAAERPGDEGPAADALSEAPTAFMAQPEVPEGEGAEAAPAESAGKRRPAPQIADLQEPPEAEAPADEEAPAMEHEAVAEPAEEDDSSSPSGHSTEERQAIAEQPTEMYDIEEELGGTDRESPSEDDLVAQEVSEPRLSPMDPLASVEEGEAGELAVTDAREGADAKEADDLDDEFWDEKRLSDELDQALEGPPEPDPPSEPEAENEAEPEASGEQPIPEDDAEDVLDETPDFLEEAPEDDQLWFEQKPPKDFDFDD